MLEAIAATPELAKLGARRDDDYSITLLDLWAAVADVLTFYQERYANEVFLRTAQQPQSLRRLAGLLGYDPRPGVAAEAQLAFTVDQGKTVQIPVGLRVQSMPAQNRQPQTFETLEQITADYRFNRLRIYPPPGPPGSWNPLQQFSPEAILNRSDGPRLAANLAANDPVVIFNDGGSDPVEEKKIAGLRTEDDRIVLTWTQPVQGSNWGNKSTASKFRRTFRLFGYNAPATYMKPSSSSAVPGGILWSLTSTNFSNSGGADFYLDSRYDDLGTGTMLLFVIPGSIFATSASSLHSAIVTPGPIPIPEGVRTFLRKVVVTRQGPGTVGPMTDTVTHIFLDSPIPSSESFDLRKVVIYELVGDAIKFWDSIYKDTLNSATVYLPGRIVKDDGGVGVEVGRTIQQNAFTPGVVLHPQDIGPGRKVLLTDAQGKPFKATVHAAPTIDAPNAAADPFGHLVLTLDLASISLQTASAVLLGNVVLASHGETANNEVVGSGDASKQFQEFTLQKEPLTYVPGSGPNGVISSLKVRVNGLLWQEVPGLFEQPASAQVFSTRAAEDLKRVLQFGDGKTGGAVLPTGPGNVTATYRVGAGLAGRVGANALTVLLDSLQGLTAVTNPLAAEGGADPETTDTIRQNAPRTVRTFGRAVSLRDFEDLITASGEVAKAEAIWVWDGFASAVYVTVAGQAGGTFSNPASLAVGLSTLRDPNHRLLVGNYQRVPIRLSATVLVAPQYVQDDVLKSALDTLLAALSFDSLKLGQSIHLSGVYSVLKAVAGVKAVDITLFGFRQPDGMSPADFKAYLDRRAVERLPDGTVAPVQGHLRIFSARPDAKVRGQVLPAELAWISTPGQDVSITAQGH
jgi:hypothetical protein